MLAQEWRRLSLGQVGFGKAHRTGDLGHIDTTRVRNVAQHAPGLDLRVLEHIGHRVDRTAGNARGVELVDQLRPCVARELRLEQRRQSLDV